MAFNVPFSSGFENQVSIRELPSAIEAVQQRLHHWEDKSESLRSDLVLDKIRTELTHLFRCWEKSRSQEIGSLECLIHTQLDALNTRIEKHLDSIILTRIHFQAETERNEKNSKDNPFSTSSDFRPGHA